MPFAGLPTHRFGKDVETSSAWPIAVRALVCKRNQTNHRLDRVPRGRLLAFASPTKIREGPWIEVT